MPRYEFECHDCQLKFEERRPFAQADFPAECPLCHEFATTKVIVAVPDFARSGYTIPEPALGRLESLHRAKHGAGCPCCG